MPGLDVLHLRATNTFSEQLAEARPQNDGDEAGKNEGTELITDVYDHQTPAGHPRLHGDVGTELHALGQYFESDAPTLKGQEHDGTGKNFPPPRTFGKHQREEQREAIGIDQGIELRCQ